MTRHGSTSPASANAPPRIVLLLESSRASGRAILRGIAHYAHLHGPWSFQWEPAGLDEAWPRLRTADADGIILRDVGKVDQLLHSGIPAVVVGHRRTEISGLVNVVTDSEAIGRLAAEHLLACGLRAFAYAGLARSSIENTPWSQQREDSFRERLREAHLPLHVDTSASPLQPSTWRQELHRLGRWLRTLPQPIGLLACNDDRGQQIIEACRLAGLSVPDQVAVLGVDNDDLIAGLSTPPMSSIALNFERAGYESAEMLDQMIHGREPRDRKILVRPSHVVTRHSTNILAVEDPFVAQALRVIRDQSRQNLSVDQVARATGSSRRALEQRFRRVLRRSIFSEIRRVRVELIAQLLAATSSSIAEIAEQLGFDGPQHFARYFRSDRGITPREFRRRCRPN